MSEMSESPTSNSEKQSLKMDDKFLVSRREAAALLSISETAIDFSSRTTPDDQADRI
jgi:hypothetical protein